MGLQLLAEAPLEALVFRHPAIAGGSLWTWLAVVAAVLGLWRIRSAAAASRTTESPNSRRGHAVPSRGDPSSSDLHSLPCRIKSIQHGPILSCHKIFDRWHNSTQDSNLIESVDTANFGDLLQMKAVTEKQQQPEAEAQIPTVIAVERGCSVGFARKGAIFELRSCLAAEEDDVDGRVEEDVTEAVKECSWNELEYRGSGGGFVEEGSWKGDLGWYQYQYLAALDGRVVRLWEDEKRVAAPPLRRRRRWLHACSLVG